MPDQIEGGRKHVAIIVGTELLARDAEGGTRNACGEKIYAGKGLVPQVTDVLLDYVPLRSVPAESGAELRLVFDRSSVMEAGHLKTEGLTTTACTKL